MSDVERYLRAIPFVVNDGSPAPANRGRQLVYPGYTGPIPRAKLEALRDAALQDRSGRPDAAYLRDVRVGSQ